MIFSSAVTAGVDLKSNAVVLAQRLGSKVHFLEAVQDLKAWKNAPSFYFCRHSRKIVTLIEIAKKTLLAMGVQPYPFSSCPLIFVDHKAAYIDLLFLLKERLHDIDPSLEARVNSLLFPLYAESHVASKGEHSPGPFSSGPFPRVPPVFRGGRPSRRLVDTPSAVRSATLMPPPEYHPLATNVTERRQTHLRRNTYEEDEKTSSRHLLAANPGDNEQENDIPPVRLYKPLGKRFGIFCTPKSSMHTYRQPTTYSRPALPLKE